MTTQVNTVADLAVVTVQISADPLSDRAVSDLKRLRAEIVPAAFGAEAARVLVTGTTAENVDYFDVMGFWLPIVIAFVLALSFGLLTLAFRSVAIAATAIGVNLLSVSAAYGMLVLVFQQGVRAGLLGFTQVSRIEAWVPIFLFGVLFGLSMDYQVFLLCRIHERLVGTGDTNQAVTFGVASTARLITGAAADHRHGLRRLRPGRARHVPGDGLRHRDRAGPRRDRRAPGGRPRGHGAARRPELVPAGLARLDPARREVERGGHEVVAEPSSPGS